MMTELKLPYGLKNDQLISIDEVDSGLSCECICPACRQQLIARKGSIKIHHFAHYKSPDCFGGFETALHQMCKEIIFNNQTFTTPTLYYPGTHYEIFEERKIPIDNVQLEKKLGGIIPDIIIESKGKKLVVEIVVNNPVDDIKRQKIKSENIATIVIEAKYLIKGFYLKGDYRLTDEAFQKELVEGTKFKYWLHNPKLQKIRTDLKNNYGIRKQVKSFETDIGFYYYVDNCPLQKRFWKGGRNKGKPYASIENDCNNCIFCISIDNNFIPNIVNCIGHIKNEFRQLL